MRKVAQTGDSADRVPRICDLLCAQTFAAILLLAPPEKPPLPEPAPGPPSPPWLGGGRDQLEGGAARLGGGRGGQRDCGVEGFGASLRCAKKDAAKENLVGPKFDFF